MIEVVFGTYNPGKLADAKQITQALKLDLKIIGLSELGLSRIKINESGQTFEENARIKYETLRPHIQPDLSLVTDDSGLEIDALGGKPGIHSRRWDSDDDLTDEELIAKMQQELEGKQDRRARFVAVAAFAGVGNNVQIRSAELVGEILKEPDLEGAQPGYPFRAFFYVPQAGKMLYQIHDLPFGERNNIKTHREILWEDVAKAIVSK